MKNITAFVVLVRIFIDLRQQPVENHFPDTVAQLVADYFWCACPIGMENA